MLREKTQTYNRDWPNSTFQCPHANWPDAFLVATYLINRTIVLSLVFISPWQKLFLYTLNYATLRVFGCACYSWLRPYVKHKLDLRTKKRAFMGYSLNHMGYRYLDPSIRNVSTSRHVVFDESSFPFKASEKTTPHPINEPFHNLSFTKWFFPQSYNFNSGHLHTSELVSKWFYQGYDINYHERFSPAVKQGTIGLSLSSLFSLASSSIGCYQHGFLNENIYDSAIELLNDHPKIGFANIIYN